MQPRIQPPFWRSWIEIPPFRASSPVDRDRPRRSFIKKNLSAHPRGLLLSYPVQTRKSLLTNFQSYLPHPSHLKTTKVGSTVSFTGQPEGDGIFELALEIHRKTFLGFINYGKPITSDATDWLGRNIKIIVTENSIAKPVFVTDRINASIYLTERSYLVLRNLDAHPVDPKGRPFAENKSPTLLPCN